MKIITIITFSITLFASVVSSQNLCNGYNELCEKKYSDVAYATTHNAYSVGKSVAANQNYDIPTQLKDGIRGFMLDAVYPANSTANSTEVHLCHNTCDLLDHGPVTDTLSQFVTWLNNNPSEVITILWENAGNVPAKIFGDIYTQAGFAKFAYFQETGKDWPTLNEIIKSGKRAINFVDKGADPSVPWLMEEYDYVFETPYQNTDVNAFQCTVDRPKNQQRPMYVLNHFLYGTLAPPFSGNGNQVDLPQPDKANTTNSANLAGHAKQCQQTFGKIPNFIAVDFYDKGNAGQNVLSAVADLNGVKYIPKQLGDGSNNSKSNPSNNANNANNANPAQPNNIIAGLAGVGTLAMFML